MVNGTTGNKIELPFYAFEKVSSIKVRNGYTFEAFTKEGNNGHGNLMKRFTGEISSMGQYNDKMASYTCSNNRKFEEEGMVLYFFTTLIVTMF